ncbi:hypothetical protein ANO11243_091030 [Dothideomycetidae sp. 11243]|nr:hypothetical protein ANO11243_091030 [fungal sp. No.11243]
MAATPAESTPLLQEQYITDSRAEEDGIQDFSESWTKPRVNSVILVYVMIALLVLATALSAAASARLYENGLCREYCLQHDASWVNPDGSVPERLCKVPGVQAGLSKIMTRVAIGEQVLGSWRVKRLGCVIFALGSGGQMSLYSFANGLVDNIYVTAIYTYGALADGVGMLAGTAVVSSVLREGLATGEIRPGLPFCLVAGAYLICFILILLASRK